MNKELKCVDCGSEFNYSERDQEFYEKMGFAEPKRCRDCRMKKKAKKAQEGGNSGFQGENQDNY